MDIKYNLLVILLFTTTIHSQDLDEFVLRIYDLDSGDEMLMMDVAVDPLFLTKGALIMKNSEPFLLSSSLITHLIQMLC